MKSRPLPYPEVQYCTSKLQKVTLERGSARSSSRPSRRLPPDSCQSSPHDTPSNIFVTSKPSQRQRSPSHVSILQICSIVRVNSRLCYRFAQLHCQLPGNMCTIFNRLFGPSSSMSARRQRGPETIEAAFDMKSVFKGRVTTVERILATTASQASPSVSSIAAGKSSSIT